MAKTATERKPTKKQLLDELHLRLGKCRALIEDKKEPRPCTNWAINERGWCGQHYASAVERELREERKAAAKAELLARIDEYIAAEPARQQATLDWVARHVPAVTGAYDRSAARSSTDPVQSAPPVPPVQQRRGAGTIWRASDGLPLTLPRARSGPR